MSILDMFRSTQQQQGPQDPNQQQPPTPQQHVQQNANAVPDAFKNTPAADPNASKSPLDEFEGLFKIQDNKDDPEKNLTAQLFDFDQDKMGKAAESLNFVQGIDEEVIGKAMQGDQRAFMQVLNRAAQNAFLQGTQLNTKLIQQGVDRRIDAFQDVLPHRFRDFQVSNSPVDENPVFNHAAMRPVVKALQEQAMKAYPDASPQEVNSMVKKYLSAFSQSISPQGNNGNSQNSKEIPPTMDFSQFF